MRIRNQRVAKKNLTVMLRRLKRQKANKGKGMRDRVLPMAKCMISEKLGFL